MGGESGRFGLVHFLQRLVGVGAAGPGQRIECPQDPREQLAGFFHRHDGVVEGRRRGIVGDRVDLGQLAFHALFDGRLKIAVLDAVELRRLERQRAGFEERIGFGYRRRRRGRRHGFVLRGTGDQRQNGDGAQTYRANSRHRGIPSRLWRRSQSSSQTNSWRGLYSPQRESVFKKR